MCANVHRCPAYLLNPGIIFVLLIPQQQWRLFQLKKCAHQFVRMDDLGFAVTMRANQSTAGRAVCAAIAPRPACSRTSPYWLASKLLNVGRLILGSCGPIWQ